MTQRSLKPLLFEPLTLGALTLPNRIVIAPMCQYSAVDGQATDWHLIHFGQMLTSGAGLFIIEATAVAPEARISARDLGLWSDDTAMALARVLQRVRQYTDMPVGIQLGHAGRKASSQIPWVGGGQLALDASDGWQAVAPSAVAHNSSEVLPHALSLDEIQQVIDDFVAAAQRAVAIGIQLIEIHAAHGYLLHQFLSPLANRRTDEYGGSLENRMRLALEVFSAVRAAVPTNIPVGVRISATDWVAGGWDIEQSIALSKRLEALGTAYIHVSSGGVSPEQQIPFAPGYQVPLAAAVRAAIAVPVIAVGLITEPEQAEAILEQGDADLIALARGMLYDPHWPWHAAAKLGAQVKAPPQYWRSEPAEGKGLFMDAQVDMR